MKIENYYTTGTFDESQTQRYITVKIKKYKDVHLPPETGRPISSSLLQTVDYTTYQMLNGTSCDANNYSVHVIVIFSARSKFFSMLSLITFTLEPPCNQIWYVHLLFISISSIQANHKLRQSYVCIL